MNVHSNLQLQKQHEQQALHQADIKRPGVRKSCTRPISGAFSYLMLLAIFGTLMESARGDWLMDCGDCHCKWNSGKKTADCKNLSMTTVPENLSSEVQVLDLSYNRIPYLEQNAFLTANLPNLHKLFMRNSSVQQIDEHSFTQLEILIELDLSNNLLRTLHTNLFVRLVKVRALVLNGNLLETLQDGIFENLKYLHKIELKDNRLTHIGLKAFENLPLLSQIYLDGNRLSYLRKESFESLKRLTSLSLDQNFWNCTCELQLFRDFVLRRNLYTPPTSCYYPKHLRGMLWVEQQPEAFACKPNIIFPARGASIHTSKENVTLICRVHASPNTLIAWDFNKQLYRANAAGLVSSNTNTNSNSNSKSNGQGVGIGVGLLGNTLGQHNRIHIQLLRDEETQEQEFGRDIFISRLTILGAEKSDEGVYTCLAENAGGKVAVQMSLLVEKPGPRTLLLQGNLITVISLMALGLLSVAVFLALVTCCIYKRFKVIDQAPHRHQHLNQVVEGGDPSATNVDGRTDVVLNAGDHAGVVGSVATFVGMDATTTHLKHHLQKSSRANVCDKYDEVSSLHQHSGSIEGLVDVRTPSSGPHYQRRLYNDAGKLECVDKTYMERNTEGKRTNPLS